MTCCSSTLPRSFNRTPIGLLATLGVFCMMLSALPARADDIRPPAPRAVASTGKPAEPLEQMLRNAKKMQSQLTRARSAKDPQERERLLQAYMQTSRENMVLGRNLVPGGAPGPGPAAGHGGMMGGGMASGGMMGGASGGMGGGGMAQHGMGQSMTGGGMAHFFASLDLSDKQFAEVNRIHDETRKKQWELRGKRMDEESRLRSLLYADKPDPAAVGEAYKRIADLRRQMIETCVEGHNRIADVLSTPEQKDKLKRMWREMGPAMMER